MHGVKCVKYTVERTSETARFFVRATLTQAKTATTAAVIEYLVMIISLFSRAVILFVIPVVVVNLAAVHFRARREIRMADLRFVGIRLGILHANFACGLGNRKIGVGVYKAAPTVVEQSLELVALAVKLYRAPRRSAYVNIPVARQIDKVDTLGYLSVVEPVEYM